MCKIIEISHATPILESSSQEINISFIHFSEKIGMKLCRTSQIYNDRSRNVQAQL